MCVLWLLPAYLGGIGAVELCGLPQRWATNSALLPLLGPAALAQRRGGSRDLAGRLRGRQSAAASAFCGVAGLASLGDADDVLQRAT
jgi:hypothetical protein